MTASGIDDRVVIINKPPGLTSHEVSTYVKKICGASRAGHAGTLDPDVSGVLPVALGRATKLLRYIAAKDKTYVGIVKFRNIMPKEMVAELFRRFTGELTQTPPKISAVRKVPRKRTVYSLRLLELEGRLALFETRVDAGTYIRTLCEDMGKVCGGARMVELRRIAVGKITEKEAHTMTELIDAMWFRKNKESTGMLDAMLRRPETFIDLPKVGLKASALKSILSGAQVMVPAIAKIGDVKKGEKVALYCEGSFVGVGRMEIAGADFQHKTRGPAIRMERVHLPHS
ncbi:RNA-guided pseudouridylation complex pseudouridine synthase subunit Cbf5 [Candidatus Micrarchaeota archaeon]|nr:RNA-guided pseudouridylation complex pseudouridine synthase subunit Cbf5 [Candidatus Micrarchaeota archaeon]